MAVLGRTNASFPPIWLSLQAPHDPVPGFQGALVEAALAAQTVLDISHQPSLWGGQMRGTDAKLMMIGGSDAGKAPDGSAAANAIHASLVSTLSAIGRDHIELYYLDYTFAWEEHQINGALEGLETAKQDGIIGHIGLFSRGSSLATLGMWQFHDAFETALVRRNPVQEDYDVLKDLAHERRAGLVTCGALNWGYDVPFTALESKWRLRNLTQSFYGLSAAQAAIAHYAQEHPVVVGVRTPQEIQAALEGPQKTLPQGIDVLLSEIANDYREIEIWRELQQDERAWLAKAARRAVAREEA